MRLAELNPRWFSEPGRDGQGVVFDCPCCLSKPLERRVRLAVAFENPIDGMPPITINAPGIFWAALRRAMPEGSKTITVPGGIQWQRAGEDFDTLTLFPSLDFSPSGDWHGWVRNGVIT